jgi:hypothetical protein
MHPDTFSSPFPIPGVMSAGYAAVIENVTGLRNLAQAFGAGHLRAETRACGDVAARCAGRRKRRDIGNSPTPAAAC